MTDTNESPLETATGISDHTTDAFSVLSNETRLSILVALWENDTPFESSGTVPFSDLREKVGTGDSGQFNYHLDKLRGRYVVRTENGYRLTRAGARIVRAVIAWSSAADTQFSPVELDSLCPFCGAPVELGYENERIHISCTSCPGGGPKLDNNIVIAPLPPAGLENRSAPELLQAVTVYTADITSTMLEGVCPECGGRVETQFDLCEDHDTDTGVCDTCELPFLARIEMVCETCEAPNRAPSCMAIMDHPAVVSFFYDHGIEHWYNRWEGMLRGTNCTEEVLSQDPIRIRITVPVGDDELHVTITEQLDVVEISGH